MDKMEEEKEEEEKDGEEGKEEEVDKDEKKLLRPSSNPYNSLTRPQKVQNDPQKQKKIRKTKILQNESYQP